jgi:Na+/H+ antiporter NhaD/arsenite permease-like protein
MHLGQIAGEIRIAAGTLIFLVSYFVFAWGRLPGTKIDRPAMATMGAAALFLIGVLNPASALQDIDFPTLVLLFSMMLLVAGLHQAGFFEWITAHVLEKIPQRHLLAVAILTGGILSAFLVNDVVCLFMTPLVLRITSALKRPATPYLLALATASNIGSTATITGNPQNMLIASVSHIGYLDFMFHLGPIALVGLGIDWLVLRIMCSRELARELTPGEQALPSEARLLPSPLGADVVRRTPGPARAVWKPLVITILVLAGFLAGWEPALVAVTGAALLLITRRTNPRDLYREVDWSLLLFFAGLFLIVGGAERIHITGYLLNLALHMNLQNTMIFTAVASLLSNLVSNVPAVMLLRPVVGRFPAAHHGWLVLSMASTLAGNLTITGSVANIIVVEKSSSGAHIGFKEYLRVGVPITFLTLLLGIAWLHFVP